MTDIDKIARPRVYIIAMWPAGSRRVICGHCGYRHDTDNARDARRARRHHAAEHRAGKTWEKP